MIRRAGVGDIRTYREELNDSTWRLAKMTVSRENRLRSHRRAATRLSPGASSSEAAAVRVQCELFAGEMLP